MNFLSSKTNAFLMTLYVPSHYTPNAQMKDFQRYAMLYLCIGTYIFNGKLNWIHDLNFNFKKFL